MASVRKRGDGYSIRVLVGFDQNGKRINANKTWKPDRKMSEEKALEMAKAVAAEFEKEVRCGNLIDENMTLNKYVSEIWLKKIEKEIKATTFVRYESLLDRILPALGYMKLYQIQPPQIRAFLDDLYSEKREDVKLTPTSKAIELAKSAPKTRLAEKTGVSATTIACIAAGNRVKESSAIKFADAFGKKVDKLFVRHEESLSATTILHHYRVLSAILTAAMQDGIIKDNPCRRVKPPKAGSHMCHYLDDKEAARLIRLVLEKGYHPFDMIIILLLHTGMRRGECCALFWDDIDFENNTISISHSIKYLTGRGIFDDTPKNESSVRVIKVGQTVMDMLREYRVWQEGEADKLGDKWENSGRVFTSEKGGVINPDTVSSWFHKFVISNDLPYVSIHSLRHTHATILISSGVPITTAAKRLGHTTAATTTKVYAHTIASVDAKAAEFMDSILPVMPAGMN